MAVSEPRDWNVPYREPEIQEPQAQLDELYAELAGLHTLEPDVALLRLAYMGAWAAAVRNRLSRSQSMYTRGFVKREIEPFIIALAIQARLLERVGSIRRARHRT